jgi:hypothetical protein
MTWEFTANSPDELAQVRQSLPQRAKPTVAGELFPMRFLLEALAQTEVPAFPFIARHTGEHGVPDFQLVSGTRRIAVEIAKVTTQNLEHARAVQAELPDPPSHFDVGDLCYPEEFAQRLKAGRDCWARFLAGRLSDECRAWLASWNGRDAVPHDMNERLIADMNAVIDGPPIAGDRMLQDATPRPKAFQVEGFPRDETPHQRKLWLEDAFWEQLAVPINRTLMVTPFIRQDDARMTRAEVLSNGFLVPALPTGPTLEEEHQIWVERVGHEIQDKAAILAGGDFLHGDEDWLVLWDRLGTADWQVEGRAQAIEKRLAPIGKPGWFSRVFIQEEFFEWQLMFTPGATVNLPRRNGPTK